MKQTNADQNREKLMSQTEPEGDYWSGKCTTYSKGLVAIQMMTAPEETIMNQLAGDIQVYEKLMEEL